MDSCHHESWLESVPKSQYMLLKCNCTNNEELLTQAAVLTQRFEEKVYNRDSLSTVLEETNLLDRQDLLRVKPPRENQVSQVPFITTYSVQHKSIKNLINKHWHIINNDQILRTVLPNRPQMVYKGAPSLRNRVAPNVLNSPIIKASLFENLAGFYQCRRCRVCSHNGCTQRRTHMFSSTSTSREHEIELFITCFTEGVVYLNQCPCGLQYVGRTKRPLSVRLNEHITNIKSGFLKHSVSKHYILVHNKDRSRTIFMGIDKYCP